MIRLDESGTVEVVINATAVTVPITNGRGDVQVTIPTLPTVPDRDGQNLIRVGVNQILIHDVIDQLEKVTLERQIAERDKLIAQLERKIANAEAEIRRLRDRLNQATRDGLQTATDSQLWDALVSRYTSNEILEVALKHVKNQLRAEAER